MTAPARHNHVFHGLKKPEIAYLPTACAEALPFRRQPCFRATVPIWDGNRGDSRGKPPNPHTFLCMTWSGLPVPRRPAIPDRARLAPRLSGDNDPGSRLARPGFRSGNLRLLELNLGASLLELSLDLLGFVLVDAFLDRLGRALDEVLGFLEAEAGDGADFLDDFDLLLAGGGEHYREVGLFLGGSGGSAPPGRTGPPNPGTGGHPPPFFLEIFTPCSPPHGQAREV